MPASRIAVEQEADPDALAGLADDKVPQAGAGAVALPDVVFEVQRFLGGLDGLLDQAEGFAGVGEQADFVAADGRGAADACGEAHQGARERVVEFFGQDLIGRDAGELAFDGAVGGDFEPGPTVHAVNAEDEEQQSADVRDEDDRHHPGDGAAGLLLFREQDPAEQQQREQVAGERERRRQPTRDCGHENGRRGGDGDRDSLTGEAGNGGIGGLRLSSASHSLLPWRRSEGKVRFTSYHAP
jgi:hypothetical protein